MLKDRCRKWNARKMMRFYHDHAQEPDFSQKYIYFPLHLQPEVSSFPVGGAFATQLLIAQLIASLLPDDVFLLIKENPAQWRTFPDGMGRDPMLYHDLQAIRNVRFVPIQYNTFRLIENATAVATITGTAGFEALFREKPVLMFGHRFYEYASGVYYIRTIDDCKNALHAILNLGVKPKLEDAKLFLKAIEDVCIRGSLGSDRLSSSLSDEENAETIASALRKRTVERLPAFCSS